MAVYQATKKPAVSLPNGASSLPPDVLPLLERFDKIYLWMDHDGAGQAGVDKFVQKLVRTSASSRRFLLYDQAYVDRGHVLRFFAEMHFPALLEWLSSVRLAC